MINQRMCIGCRQSSNKKSLIRIVKNKSGEIVIDSRGNAEGRGAYIHKDLSCYKTTIKKRSLDRALKCKIPEEIYQILENEMNGSCS